MTEAITELPEHYVNTLIGVENGMYALHLLYTSQLHQISLEAALYQALSAGYDSLHHQKLWDGFAYLQLRADFFQID